MQKTASHRGYDIEEYPLDEMAGLVMRPYFEAKLLVESGDIFDDGAPGKALGTPEQKTLEVASWDQWYKTKYAAVICARSFESIEHARKLAVEARQDRLRKVIA